MLGASLTVSQYLERTSAEFAGIESPGVERLAAEIHSAYEEGRFVFLCGNGGSGANCSHIAEDLAKSTLERADYVDGARKRLKVISLTDNTSAILAWANDEGFETVFVEQLKSLASADDMLITLSGSGNSANVLRAVEWANKARLRTWGVTGFDGGKLRDEAQESIHIPLADMGLIESIHLLLFHWILDDVQARIYSKGRYAPKPAAKPAATRKSASSRKNAAA
jgi:D-sedoheptulose 7-phosphate isomerase